MDIENYDAREISGDFNNPNILFFYKGVINNNLISVLADQVEVKLYDSYKLSQKINRALIELAQNIVFYSYERVVIRNNKKGIGYIKLEEFDAYYLLTTINRVNEESAVRIQQEINYINSRTLEELKSLRAKRRSESGKFENHCNIGLIQVYL